MDTDNVLLIVCGVLTFVVLLNAGLVFSLLRGRNRDRFRVIGKAIEVVQNPWREQDEQFGELRRRIVELEEKEVEDHADGSR